MVTTTATVTAEGFALSAEFMAEHHLAPGTQVKLIRTGPTSFLIEQIIDETPGLFSKNEDMTDQLLQHRREEQKRFESKW